MDRETTFDKRFDDMYRYTEARFQAVDRRFDANGLEEVMDARLRHLEDNQR